MYEVLVYTDARGRSPLEQLFQELSPSDTKRVFYAIERLEQDGTWVARDIEDGIWELRPGAYRILFFHVGNGKFVLLHGFRKKSKETPRREKDRAKRERADWLDRNGHRES